MPPLRARRDWRGERGALSKARPLLRSTPAAASALRPLDLLGPFGAFRALGPLDFLHPLDPLGTLGTLDLLDALDALRALAALRAFDFLDPLDALRTFGLLGALRLFHPLGPFDTRRPVVVTATLDAFVGFAADAVIVLPVGAAVLPAVRPAIFPAVVLSVGLAILLAVVSAVRLAVRLAVFLAVLAPIRPAILAAILSTDIGLRQQGRQAGGVQRIDRGAVLQRSIFRHVCGGCPGSEDEGGGESLNDRTFDRHGRLLGLNGNVSHALNICGKISHVKGR